MSDTELDALIDAGTAALGIEMQPAWRDAAATLPRRRLDDHQILRRRGGENTDQSARAGTGNQIIGGHAG